MNIPGNYNGCMVFFKEMKIRYNSDLIFEKNGGVLNFTLILAIVFPSPKYYIYNKQQNLGDEYELLNQAGFMSN